MNPHELTDDNRAILNCVRQDYFWQVIPFQRIHTALDIGGHIGLWSHVCHTTQPHVTITALEPHPDNFRQLVRNVPAATCVWGWCGYESGGGLYCRADMSGSHYVLRVGETPPMNGHVLPLPPRYTLEDFSEIDLLKLDCEGSEFDILLNCKRATLDRIQVIVGEYHLERGDFADIEQRLTDCGFTLTISLSSSAPHLGHFLAMRDA
jgi:hypothetical protein